MKALALRGVEAFVLSQNAGNDVDEGRLHVRSLRLGSPRDHVGTLGLLARGLRRYPLRNLTDREFFRTARVEHFAAQLIRRERIDLVHSYFARPGGLGGLLAARATGIPIIAALRGSDVNVLPDFRYGSRLDPSFDRALRYLLLHADRTVSVSEFVRKQAITLGAPAAKARVILKGVRLDLFTDRLRDEAKTNMRFGAAPFLLSVAGLTRIKGLHHVLDALALVRDSGQPFSYVVCGEGAERAALERQVSQLGLEGMVSFPGKVSRADVAQYFAAADLFLHGAIIEASGNVLLEAMASGVPAICTDAGGPSEYVEHEVAGLIVPVGDPKAMATAVCRLLSDQEARRRMGVQARRLAESRFSYERMIDETLALYASLLDNRK